MDMYAGPRVTCASGGKLLCDTGSSAWQSMMTQRGGREAQGTGHVCLHRADSRCCLAETNTVL